MVERPAVRDNAGAADAPECRFQSDRATQGCRDTDRSAGIRTHRHRYDPGGNGIDRIGPVSEAIVIWVGGVGVLMIAILWIGARNR